MPTDRFEGVDEGDRQPSYPPGTIRVGTIGGIPVLVRGSWIVVTLLLAVLFAPQIDLVEPGLGPWKYVAGVCYAVLLYLTVLLHEMSHALLARRYGLDVQWMALSFLGGMTAIDGDARTPGEEFKIAAIGPITSLGVGGLALLGAQWTSVNLIGLAVWGVAGFNLLIGGLNLVPGLPLDGGRVLQAAVWKTTGDTHQGTIVAAWAGRVVAVLVLFWPLVFGAITHQTPHFTDYLIAWVVAIFLWTGASASIRSAQIRRRLPALHARALARPVIAVPEDLPLSEAVRRAQEAGAGGIVTHSSDDRLSAVVSEAALHAVPPDQRPWQSVITVARHIEDGLMLPADIGGEDLIRAMGRTPSAEYVLLEPDGRIYGLLSTADVDRAFARTSVG